MNRYDDSLNQSSSKAVPHSAHMLSAHGNIMLCMTTFMSLPDKFKQAVQCLTSFVDFNGYEVLGIRRFLIVNEVPRLEHDTKRNWHADFRQAIQLGIEKLTVSRHVLSRLEFIQKTGDRQRGQARSLNMILNRLRSETTLATLLLLEESWQTIPATKPWLMDVIMTLHYDLHQLQQLQLTNDWKDAKQHLQIPRKGHNRLDYIAIKPAQTLKWYKTTPSIYWNRYPISYWPLFSLRPFVAKTALLTSIGDFPEEEAMWPVTFENRQAQKWLIAHYERNGIDTTSINTPKAVTNQILIERQFGHKSTYIK